MFLLQTFDEAWLRRGQYTIETGAYPHKDGSRVGEMDKGVTCSTINGGGRGSVVIEASIELFLV